MFFQNSTTISVREAGCLKRMRRTMSGSPRVRYKPQVTLVEKRRLLHHSAFGVPSSWHTCGVISCLLCATTIRLMGCACCALMVGSMLICRWCARRFLLRWRLTFFTVVGRWIVAWGPARMHQRIKVVWHCGFPSNMGRTAWCWPSWSVWQQVPIFLSEFFCGFPHDATDI